MQLIIQRELGLSRDDSRIVLFVALVYFSPPAGWGNTPYQRQVVLLRRAWAFVREHTPRRRYV